MSARAVEGRAPYRGYSTWYHVAGGESDATPLLLLHGGPGDTSVALEPYDDLSATGRKVVRYDQIGGGHSSLRDVPHDPEMWSIPLFVEEIDSLRAHLGLDEVHLLGHSWGGQLALEYALTGAQGIRSLVLQSTLASLEEWTSESRRLVAELPEELQEAIAAHERGEEAPLFETANTLFERRHLLRLDEEPDCWKRRTALVEGNLEVYRYMVGDAEFSLRPGSPFVGWDLRPRLAETDAPTLLLSGVHDEATPAIMRTLHEGIRGSEWHLLEESSHCCHLEETGRTLVLVADFLARVDAASGPTPRSR
jgi:proline-specific peptidase